MCFALILRINIIMHTLVFHIDENDRSDKVILNYMTKPASKSHNIYFYFLMIMIMQQLVPTE